MKKIISGLLALVMVLSLAAFPAHAEEGIAITSASGALASGTYYLPGDVTAELTIPSGAKVTIDLCGHTLTGEGGIVITVAGSLTLKDSGGTGEITGGKYGIMCTGTFRMEGGTITGNDCSDNNGYGYGGGVCNTGTFNMTGGSIAYNTADNGGGVYTGGTFKMDAGTALIAYNSASYGGGVYVVGDGDFQLAEGVISGNSAVDGGGVYSCVAQDFVMDAGEIKNNYASVKGGGVYTQKFIMNGGAIYKNSADDGGGGIFLSCVISAASAYCTVMDGYIYENATYVAAGITRKEVSSDILTEDGVTMTIYAAVNAGTAYTGWIESWIINGQTEVLERTLVINGSYLVSHTDYHGMNAAEVPIYTLTYDANGGSGAPDSQKVAQASPTLTISKTVPTRAGYTFWYWCNRPDGFDQAYDAGEEITIEENTTLYAWWKAIDCTITYYKNDGSSSESIQKVYAMDVTLQSSDYWTREGYTFDSWNTAADGTGTSYAAGTTPGITTDTTLYAQWTTNSYTLTYNANGGEGTVPSAKKYDYGTSVTLDDGASLTKEGYTFSGWNTASNGTGTSYAAGEDITITADTVLYAQWTEVTVSWIIADNVRNGMDLAMGFYIPQSKMVTPTDYKVVVTLSTLDGDITSTITSANSSLWKEKNTSDGTECYFIIFEGIQATQMVDTVTVRIFKGEEEVCDPYTTSIQNYEIRFMAAYSGNENAVALAKAVLEYGAAAQTYYNYRVDTLANSY